MRNEVVCLQYREICALRERYDLEFSNCTTSAYKPIAKSANEMSMAETVQEEAENKFHVNHKTVDVCKVFLPLLRSQMQR